MKKFCPSTGATCSPYTFLVVTSLFLSFLICPPTFPTERGLYLPYRSLSSLVYSLGSSLPTSRFQQPWVHRSPALALEAQDSHFHPPSFPHLSFSLFFFRSVFSFSTSRRVSFVCLFTTTSTFFLPVQYLQIHTSMSKHTFHHLFK